MFREIRKKRNKIEDSAAEELLQNSRRGVLAVNGDDGYPYAIPLNYFYDRENRKIYFHGARAGHKVDALRVCDKVCFTVYGNETIREEAWAPFMQSTVVFGKCHLMENGSEKAMEMLKRFAMKYYPNEQLADEEIAQAISVIFLFNVIAALTFPTLGGMLGLTNEGFGLFAGTAINDTSSVTAAASAWDSMHPGANVLESATVVKLTRTLAIIPITLVLACWQMHLARKAGGDAKSTFSLKRAFPMFVLFFVLASVITTVLQLPASITAPIKELSKFFIVMAMAAIGFNTDIVELVKKGGKPIALGFCCWIGIACMSLGMQHVLGIW